MARHHQKITVVELRRRSRLESGATGSWPAREVYTGDVFTRGARRDGLRGTALFIRISQTGCMLRQQRQLLKLLSLTREKIKLANAHIACSYG